MSKRTEQVRHSAIQLKSGRWQQHFAAIGQKMIPLMLGSVKTNIGHLESAAGIAAFMKTVLALHHKEIPPHLHLDGHLDALNPHVDWTNLPITIPTKPTPWLSDGSPRRAGVSAFGFSGTNAHVILEEAPSAHRMLHSLKDERPIPRYNPFGENRACAPTNSKALCRIFG